jgi:porin
MFNKYIALLLFLTAAFSVNAQNLLLSDFNKQINNLGINLELNYTGEVFSNLSGGFEKQTVYLANIDVIFNFDLHKLIGWNGAELKTYVLGNHGTEPSKYIGAVQGISNIAAHNTWKLYEIWLEQNLFNDNLSVLFGLYDLNSEFDTRETSSIFINPSHGIGAEFSLTGKNGPSIFPTTSLALRLKYNFSNTLNIKAGIFDGIPGNLNNPNGTHVILGKDDGVLFTSELNLISETKSFEKDYFKYALGVWYYTDEFERFPANPNISYPMTQIGNYGVYAFAEKFLFDESNSVDQGLAAFLRAGLADHRVNQIDGYLGAGINYIGLIPGRDKDVFGAAIAASRFSSNFRSLINLDDRITTTTEFEYIFELTYNFSVMDYLNIQPDIQFVFNPGGSNLHSNALAFGTRFVLKL